MIMKISIQGCDKQIKALPVTEMKYHLSLLLKALEMDREQALKSRYHRRELLDKNDERVKHLYDFLMELGALMHNEKGLVNHQKFAKAYQKLVKDAKKNHIIVGFGHQVLMIGSACSALLTGVLGGVVGGFSGFFRGIYHFHNPIPYTSAGFATGLMLGAAIGFRTPKEFKNPLVRRLQYALNGLQRVLDANQDLGVQAFKETREKVILEFKEQYFKIENGAINEAAFTDFMKRPDVPFELQTFKARFIGTTLEGYVGAHAFIKIADPLKNERKPTYLEYAPSPLDSSRPILAKESRQASAEKIMDMLTVHRLLPPFSMSYFFKKGKVGQVDCFTHINKILAATNQDLCKLSRFEGNKISRKLIGFFLEKLSPFPQDLSVKATLS